MIWINANRTQTFKKNLLRNIYYCKIHPRERYMSYDFLHFFHLSAHFSYALTYKQVGSVHHKRPSFSLVSCVGIIHFALIFILAIAVQSMLHLSVCFTQFFTTHCSFSLTEGENRSSQEPTLMWQTKLMKWRQYEDSSGEGRFTSRITEIISLNWTIFQYSYMHVLKTCRAVSKAKKEWEAGKSNGFHRKNRIRSMKIFVMILWILEKYSVVKQNKSNLKKQLLL